MPNPSKGTLVVVGSGVLVALLLLGGGVWVFTRKEALPPVESFQPPPPVPAELDDKSPGEKILLGADRAFQTKYFETALKFYKDYDLRYAGTDSYDAHVPGLWEKMRAAEAAMTPRAAGFAEYLAGRIQLDSEWKKLRARPAAEAQEDLKKFLARLPEQDGRRALIESRLAEKK